MHALVLLGILTHTHSLSPFFSLSLLLALAISLLLALAMDRNEGKSMSEIGRASKRERETISLMAISLEIARSLAISLWLSRARSPER